MPLGLRRKAQHFDVPVQDLVLRVTGSDELYEEARAAGMHFWELIQSYAVRNPGFQTSKRPLQVPEDAPEVIREMAGLAARAGVGPMFTFQGALTEFVGRMLGQRLHHVVVSCEGDHYVVTRRRVRLAVRHPTQAGVDSLAVVVKPELGPQGIYTTAGKLHLARDAADGLVVVATSCILADAAAAGASALLGKERGFAAALRYLRSIGGVHGAVVMSGERIGLTGGLELAA